MNPAAKWPKDIDHKGKTSAQMLGTIIALI
jgi:hypothetical protein